MQALRVLGHADGLDLAGVLAGTLAVGNGAVGADLRAAAAVDALALVDVRLHVLVKGNRVARADVLAAMGQTATAGVRDHIAAGGALVAGDVDDVDDIWVVLRAAHGQLHALGQNGALFIYAAAHGGRLARNDFLGNIGNGFQQVVVPGVARHAAQNLVFQVLNFGIEFSHLVSPQK